MNARAGRWAGAGRRGGMCVRGDHHERTCHHAHRTARLAFHVMRADAGTVAALAAIDWNRTPGDVCEAAEGVRLNPTLSARIASVTRIVRRRQRSFAQVREEEAPYSARSA